MSRADRRTSRDAPPPTRRARTGARRDGPAAAGARGPAVSGPDAALALQRVIGNQAIQRYLHNKGKVDDKVIGFAQQPRGLFKIIEAMHKAEESVYWLDYLDVVKTATTPDESTTPSAPPGEIKVPAPGVGPPPPGPETKANKGETAIERAKRLRREKIASGVPVNAPVENKASAFADKNKLDPGRPEQALTGKRKGQEVKGSDPNYGLQNDPQAEADYNKHVAEQSERAAQGEKEAAQLREAEAKASKLPDKPLETKTQYDYEYWFNYLWKELKNAAAKDRLEIAAQAEAAAKTQDGAILERMYKLGFVEPKEGPIPVEQVKEEPQEEAKGYPKVLPALATSGLAYRSDSRTPAQIEATKGSTSRFHRSETDPALVAEMNLDKDWNPFKAADRRQMLLLRLGSADNDLNSTVSIAVDPRDAVRFPLPGEPIAGGKRVEGGTDMTHLYVVFVKEVLDTTGMLRQQGVASFGRGELGVRSITYGSHLLHAEVERFFHDKTVGYVVGRITKVELLHKPEEYLTSLPTAALEGLNMVYNQLSGGRLSWLVQGKPEQPQQFSVDETKTATVDVKDTDVAGRFGVAADKLAPNAWYTDQKTPDKRYRYRSSPVGGVYQFTETDAATANSMMQAEVGADIVKRHAEIEAKITTSEAARKQSSTDDRLRLAPAQVQDQFGADPSTMLASLSYNHTNGGTYRYLGSSIQQALLLPRALELHFQPAVVEALSGAVSKEQQERGKTFISQRDGSVYTYVRRVEADPDLGRHFVFDVVEHEFQKQ